jgi:beta-lactamase regulating signal transducer with metallopeptidase domain
MNQVVEVMFTWVSANFLQLSILVGVVWGVSLLMRGFPARVRHGLWFLVPLKVLVPPSLGFFWSLGNLPVVREIKVLPVGGGEGVSSLVSGVVENMDAFTPVQEVTATVPALINAGADTNSINMISVLFVIWCLGLLIYSGAVIWKMFGLKRLLSNSECIDEGPIRVLVDKVALNLKLKVSPKVYLTDNGMAPFLYGFSSPKIVLSKATAQDLSQEELYRIILHELIHWKRYDLILGWYQALVQAIFWFHPLVWFAGSRLRLERECATDEMLLSLQGENTSPQDYGETLLKVVLMSRGRATVGLGILGIFERTNKLEKRLEDIMSFTSPSKWMAGVGWAVVVLIVLCVFPMGSNMVLAAADPPQEKAVALKHDSGVSTGIKSISGCAQVVRFEADREGLYLNDIAVFGSRYGVPEPPREDFQVFIYNEKKELFHQQGRPYSLFERGDPKWVRLGVNSVQLPKVFWVAINFNAQRTKGVYVHYDESLKSGNSAVVCNAVWTEKPFDWMIRVQLSPVKGWSPSPATTVVQSVSQQPQGPPRIVSITPSIGAENVDPSLDKITVVFDRDMNTKGYSWTGGGPDYPHGPKDAKAKWIDARTCVKAVTLEPAKYYRFGLNSKSYKGFQSATGEPLIPVTAFFTTAGASDEQLLKTRKPKVVSTVPPLGASGVNPSITEISVTYDIPMGGGMSWCGGGDRFPETTGKATWSEDKKTCTMPVKLKPNHEYTMGLNCPSYRSFMSASGIPADVVWFKFQTGE